MTSEEIKEKLNKLVLNQNWGTVERRTVDEHGGIPENIAIIQDTVTYIHKLESKIKRLEEYDEKRDIALHAKLIDRTRKETAKEILQHFMDAPTCQHPTIATGNFMFGKDYIRELAKKYGVEVE